MSSTAQPDEMTSTRPANRPTLLSARVRGGFKPDWLIIAGLRVVAYLLVAIVALIVIDIVIKGAPHTNWEFLTTFPSKAGAAGGILPAIVGTICLVAIALGVALPLSLITALYLNQYSARDGFSRLIRVSLLTLSGIPSIVYGLFGLALFVIILGFGASILSGGLTLAFMVTPTMAVASEEALRNVPANLISASRALGAGKLRTIWSVILPHALPGITTGALLALGRAAGETAPILLTAAAFFLPALPTSVFDEVMALPYHLFVLSTQHPDAASIEPMQYATAFVLLCLVFTASGIAFVTRNLRRS